MRVSSLYSLIRTRLPELLTEMLRVPSAEEGAPAKESLATSPSVIHYRLAGALSGSVAFFFATAGKDPVSSRFLALTIGDDAEMSGAPELARLEMTNILLGRLLGLADGETEIQIAGPGEALAGADLAAELDSGRSLRCSFRIDLPQGPAALHVWARLRKGRSDKAKHSVLIVEDSPVMRAFLEKIFRESGYRIAGMATDGLEALQMFESLHPDLTTLDIIMPKLRGTEVLRRILEKHPEAKVIMASSVSDARTVMQCLKIGAKRYIIKPYDRDTVIHAVEKVLGIGGRG